MPFHLGRWIMIYIIQIYFSKEGKKKVDQVKYLKSDGNFYKKLRISKVKNFMWKKPYNLFLKQFFFGKRKRYYYIFWAMAKQVIFNSASHSLALGSCELVRSTHNFFVIEIPSFLDCAIYVSFQKLLLLFTEKNLLLTDFLFKFHT